MSMFDDARSAESDHMSLAPLIVRYKSLLKQLVEIEAEAKAVEREILATEHGTVASAPAPASPAEVARRPRRKPGPKPRPKAPELPKTITPTTREMARVTLTAIREAGSGQPVLRRDLARHLGISDYAATHRLRRLRAMGFVEGVADDRYRVVDIVPDLADL